jgi:hypothetical protein
MHVLLGALLGQRSSPSMVLQGARSCDCLGPGHRSIQLPSRWLVPQPSEFAANFSAHHSYASRAPLISQATKAHGRTTTVACPFPSRSRVLTQGCGTCTLAAMELQLRLSNYTRVYSQRPVAPLPDALLPQGERRAFSWFRRARFRINMHKQHISAICRPVLVSHDRATSVDSRRAAAMYVFNKRRGEASSSPHKKGLVVRSFAHEEYAH